MSKCPTCHQELRPEPTARPPHANTQIGKRNPRILTDGCDACLRSLVYCDAVTDMDGQPCCDFCSH